MDLISRPTEFNASFLIQDFIENSTPVSSSTYLLEIGTVTPKPQKGNPKPRLFRIKKDNAIINRMGFNNDGVKKICARLKNNKSNVIIGGNIGKNKNTIFENSVEDYKVCFEYLFDYVDYFVLNVSSPNTPKLRELQGKKELENLILEVLL